MNETNRPPKSLEELLDRTDEVAEEHEGVSVPLLVGRFYRDVVCCEGFVVRISSLVNALGFIMRTGDVHQIKRLSDIIGFRRLHQMKVESGLRAPAPVFIRVPSADGC